MKISFTIKIVHVGNGIDNEFGLREARAAHDLWDYASWTGDFATFPSMREGRRFIASPHLSRTYPLIHVEGRMGFSDLAYNACGLRRVWQCPIRRAGRPDLGDSKIGESDRLARWSTPP